MEKQVKMVPVKIVKSESGELSLIKIDKPVRIVVEHSFNSVCNGTDKVPETIKGLGYKNWYVNSCYIVPKNTVIYRSEVDIDLECKKLRYRECFNLKGSVVPHRWIEKIEMKIERE